MFTKILALILSVCMLVTSAPFNGVAEEIGDIIASMKQKTTDSVDGSVESLGQEAEDGKDFVVKEDVEDEDEISVWDGTSVSEPTLEGRTYYIYTAAELAWLSQQVAATATASKFAGYTFMLMNDIDLDGHEWTPIGCRTAVGELSSDYSFGGIFDGQHHKIFNLKIETDKAETGLFGYVCGKDVSYAVVRNVGIINPQINVTNEKPANYGVAALIGHARYVNIDRCYVRSGSVTANTAVAGLIGRIQQSNLTNSYVQGTNVTLTTVSYTEDATDGPFPRAGGLASYCNGAPVNISNCYSTANVTATTLGDDYESGIIGYCYVASQLNNCYSEKFEPVLATNKVDPTTPSTMKVADGELKNYATKLGAAFIADANNENNGYPILVSSTTVKRGIPVWDGTTRTEPQYDSTKKTYYIYKPEELAWMSTKSYAAQSNASRFKEYTILLMNDIDLGGHDFVPIGGRSSGTASSTTYYFAGTFNGQYHKIYGLNINSTVAYTGLFGYINGGTVKNLGLIEPVIIGKDADSNKGVAAISGYAVGATFSEIFVREPIVTADYRVGGIAGYTKTTKCSFTNCYVQGGMITATTAATTGTSSSVGGIVGCSHIASSVITNCYSTASLKDGNTSDDFTGAIVGRNAASLTIANSYGENDDDVYGASSTTPTPIDNPAIVSSGTLKTYAGTLGSAYITDVADVLGLYENNGYPIFTWENPEYRLKEFYSVEKNSERNVEKIADIISKGLASEDKSKYWDDYIAAMGEAESILGNSTIESEQRIETAHKTLAAAIEDLYNTYYKSEAVVIPWNGTTVFEGETMVPPTNTAGEYEIYRAEQLAYVAAQVNASTSSLFSGKTIKLMKDIDLDNILWTPIGTRVGSTSYYFRGIFDGQHHKVYGLNISSTTYMVGLFGYVYGAAVTTTVIKNLGIIKPTVYSSDVSSSNGTAALVGSARTCTISHCFVRGGSVTRAGGVGGLIGATVSGAVTIKDCYAQGVTVSSTGSNTSYCYAGGLLGSSRIGGTIIENCYSANNTVTATVGETYRGGLVGNATDTFTVNNAYSDVYNLCSSTAAAKATVNRPSKLVESKYLQNLLYNPGSEYCFDIVMGTDDEGKPAYLNNGYPIFTCEDKKNIIRTAYYSEYYSERVVHEGLITAVYSEEYQVYKDVLDRAKAMAESTTPYKTEKQQELANELKEAAKTLKAIYDKSPLVIIPWDGNTIQEPIIDGTDYYIYTAEQLAWLSYKVAESATKAYTDATFHLMKDIDLGGVIGDVRGDNYTLVAKNEWTPIGCRTLAGVPDNNIYLDGKFEGNGHIIRNMYINDSVADVNVGFFGGIGNKTTVNELGFENAYVQATGQIDAGSNFAVGVLAGMANATSVTNCFVRNSTVIAEKAYFVGGLIGSSHSYALQILNCYVQNVKVDSKWATKVGDSTNKLYGPAVGGIIGYTRSTTAAIKNCYVAAEILSAQTETKYFGNIGGYLSSAHTVEKCFAVSGIVGNEATALIGTGSHATSISNSTATGAMKDLSYFMSQEAVTALGTAFASDLNPNNVNNGLPILYWEDPEYDMRTLYYYELNESERAAYLNVISASTACHEAFSEYDTAMREVNDLILNGYVDLFTTITEKKTRLEEAVKALYEAYYKSEDVVIPWNGTSTFDGETTVPPIVNGAWEIYRAEELAYFRDHVNAGNNMSGITVKLMKDIDLNGSVYKWTPIGGNGDAKISFGGIFDGQHHKIYGLNISSTTYMVGLFGYLLGTSATDKAYIRNVGIIEPTIYSKQSAQNNNGIASLVGSIAYAEVDHCFVRGGSVSASYRAAALVGATITGTTANSQVIKNCYAYGTTVASTTKDTKYASAGGLVAYNNAAVTLIENSYVADVTLSSANGATYTGSIMGHTTTASVVTLNNTYYKDTPFYGTAGKTLIENYPSKQVTKEELAKYASVLGSEYTYDIQTGTDEEGNPVYLNGGYPIFYCEDPESKVRAIYLAELDSERTTYGEIIKDGVSDEIWSAYEKAMNEACAIVEDDKISLEPELNAVADRLNAAITALKAAYYVSENVAIPWNGERVVELKPNNDGEYEIYTAEELAYIAYYVNSGKPMANTTIKLMKNIDLNGSVYNWTPIGGNGGTTNKFSGTFDGQHNKIKNLKITSTNKYAVGLFGYAVSATIKNLGMINPNITVTRTAAGAETDDNGVGSLVGSLVGSTVDHCFVRGGNVTSTYRAGGLIGSAVTTASTITNCYAQGITVRTTDLAANTKPQYAVAGGIVGLSGVANVKISNCYSTAITMADNTATDYTGGLVGRAVYAMTINNSYVENDNGIYGTSSVEPTVNYPSRVLESGELKKYVSSLGSEYSYDIQTGTDNEGNPVYLNGGYPIFCCEDDRAVLRRLYLVELDSERKTYGEIIKDGVSYEIWSAYENAMINAKSILEDNESTKEDLNMAAAELSIAIESLTNAYNESTDVVLPWNGELIEPNTDSDGVYLIYRAEELAWMASQANSGNNLSGKNFKIMKTLDLNGAEHNWIPIGGRHPDGVSMTANNYFAGTVDGQGNIIKNMRVDANTSGASGLFGYVNGSTITNIGVENSTVTSVYEDSAETNNGAAILVGCAVGITIDGCYVRNCKVNGKNTPVAALVGYTLTTASTISNSYAQDVELNLTSEKKTAAGIIGLNTVASTITNCYANVTATSSKGSDYTAGIVGNSNKPVTITNTYTSNNLTLYAAMIKADSTRVIPTLFGGSTAVDAEVLKGYAGILGESFCTDLLEEDAKNNGYPLLKWENPDVDELKAELRNYYLFELYSPRRDSAKMSKYVNAYAEYLTALNLVKEKAYGDDELTETDVQELIANLKFAVSTLHHEYSRDADALIEWDTSIVEPEQVTEEGKTVYKIYSAEELAWIAEKTHSQENDFASYEIHLEKDIDLGDKEWKSIGAYSAGTFKGHFDGKHHKIYGLKITNTHSTQHGYSLFGQVDGAMIKNFGVIDPEINVAGNASANYGAAAVVGRISGTGATIKHVFVRNPQISADYIAGGLIGMSYKSTSVTVTNCYVQGGSVTSNIASSTASGAGAVSMAAGGIFGAVSTNSSTASTVTVTSCYSTATLKENNSKADYTGAIVGRAGYSGQKMTIKNSYGIKDNGEDDLYGASDITPSTSSANMIPGADLKNYITQLGTDTQSGNAYYARDYLKVNAEFPIFTCEHLFGDLDVKIAEGKATLADLKNSSVIEKYNPELINNLKDAIKSAEEYLANNPDVTQMPFYIAQIETAISLLKEKDQYYTDNPLSYDNLTLTVIAPLVITLASDGTYVKDQTVKVKSNYLITGSLTLTGSNNVTLVQNSNYTTQGKGLDTIYIYSFNITGGTPSADSTTVTFEATATFNGKPVTASGTSEIVKASFVDKNNVNITFNHYHTFNIFIGTNGTARIQYSFDVTGLHTITKTAEKATIDNNNNNVTYSTAYSDNSMSQTHAFHDMDIFTGGFYCDINTANKLAEANGATSIKSIKYTTKDITNPYQQVQFYLAKVISTNKDDRIDSVENLEYLNPKEQLVIYRSTSGKTVDSNAEPSSKEVSETPISRLYGLEGVAYDKDDDFDGDKAMIKTHQATFTIDYYYVDSSSLWALYKSELSIDRFVNEELYKNADPEAWADYKEAYKNAVKVLMGGVPQGEVGTEDLNTIEGAYKYLCDAIKALKTCIVYDLNGADEGCGTPDPKQVFLYRDVSVTPSGVSYYYKQIESSELAEYNNITRTGYQCIGWSLEKNATEAVTGFELSDGALEAYTKVYATWQPNTYKIVYVGNLPDGVDSLYGLPDPQVATYDYVTPEDVGPDDDNYYRDKISTDIPIITGVYSFKGWNTEDEGTGDMYQPGDSFLNLTDEQYDDETSEGIVYLYAQWEISKVPVEFYINLPDGSELDTDNSKFSSDLVGDNAKLLILNKEINLDDYVLYASGYRHLGWSTSEGADEAMTPITVTSAMKLYAVWQKKAMTVSYDLGTGSWIESEDGEYTKPGTSVNCGEYVTLPTADDVYKAGYTLVGWTTPYDDTTSINGRYEIPDSTETEITFTAVWEKRTTTITLHHNNANVDVTTKIEGKYESELTEEDLEEFAAPNPPILKIEGVDDKWNDVLENAYTFAGWYVLTENVYVKYEEQLTFPADDIHLYAAWSMDALNAALSKVPFELEGFADLNENGVYDGNGDDEHVDGEDIYYYQKTGRENLISEKEEADVVSSAGVTFNWEDVNTATEELIKAIDALIENLADYTEVLKYVDYYNEIMAGGHTLVEDHPYAGKGPAKETSFTSDSFMKFANIATDYIDNYGVKDQDKVDKIAETLKEAYESLVLEDAVFPDDYEDYLAYAKEMNKNTVTDETSLTGADPDPGSYGYLWCESETWKAFYKTAYNANALLEKAETLTALDQQAIDDAYQAMIDAFDDLVYLPADYSALFNDEYYMSLFGDVEGNDDGYYYGIYDEAYWSSVTDLFYQIQSDNESGTYTFKDDQETVNEMISDLKELLDSPVYSYFPIYFMLNDGTEDEYCDPIEVQYNAVLQGKGPDGQPTREGYNFLGWSTTYDEEEMPGVSINFDTTTYVMRDLMADYSDGEPQLILYARWAEDIPEFTLSVVAPGGCIDVSAGGLENESTEGYQYMNDNVPYGTKVEIVAEPDPNVKGSEFLYWLDVGNEGTRNRIVSYDPTLKFTLEADWNLKAVFRTDHPDGEEYYTVIFIDTILKKVISEQIVAKGDSAEEPEITREHGEYTFVGWNKSFDNITGHEIIESEYVLSKELFTITTNINGTKTEATYKYNSPVTVTVEGLDFGDQYFKGWSFDGGKTIVSYDMTYRFYVYKTMTVTAVLADEEVEKEATVTLDITTKPAAPSGGKDTYSAEFMVTRDVPDDYVFVSSGLLLTQSEKFANKDDLTFEGQSNNSSAIKLYRTVHTGNSGQYQLTARNYTDRTFWARGYVVYLNTKTGELVTLYTEVKKATASNDENTTSN